MSSPSFRKPPDRATSPRPGLLPSEIPVSRASIAATPRASGKHRPSISSYERPISIPSASLSLSFTNDVPEEPPMKLCEACEQPVSPTWYCTYCDMTFCDTCWGRQGPHKLGKTGPDGFPHEKGVPSIVKRLKDILTPPTDPAEQQSLHIDDEDTTWFGIDRDANGDPIFQDYGRYATIMADSTTGAHKSRYPQLVSFIGQTDAGKSTLIKMLIDQQIRNKQLEGNPAFTSPVVGTVRNGNVPTSGDVHLYADPKTYFGEYPMLYADCEGLEGGENIPMSAQYRNGPTIPPKEKEKEDKKDKKGYTGHETRKKHRLPHMGGSQRVLKYADTPEKSKRQYAVTELYPRLLYTFSDVVVFVLKNPKTFESSVLSLLIKWASACMEKSVNQPTLPHAVIALNATSMEIDQREWEPEHATKVLMSTVAEAINRDPSYQQFAEYWIGRGRQILTMKDLLECYYSSVTVVRIPVKGRYMKIDEQIGKLHSVLYRKCAESFKAKRKSRMLSNSEELNTYLQFAFDHFSQTLDTPFNFMDVAFKINPIPLDFGGNILKLAVAIKNCHRFTDPRKMFRELSVMVASCILLDIARQSLKGPADEILEKAYMDYCDNALEDFCAIFWPCTFHNKKGKCVNIHERHTKGHQNAKGQIIDTGPYESDFTWEAFVDDWVRYLQNDLSELQITIQSQLASNTSSKEIAVITDLHHGNVNLFYQRLGGAQKFISHSACFCCLRELAEHPLPCGHVLCSPCVKGYGKTTEELPGMYTIAACPLHEAATIFPAPWQVYFKPALAGVRILSLDGGGVRGIVILEVLRQIELELGKRIPIQDFFDLIVGTSTGGILALGIGIKNWSVEHSIALFTKLVDKAFTPKFGGIKIGKRKYRTKPLEEALIENFKDESIFGGIHEDTITYSRKVAVTASCETGQQAVIFTNYNRAEDDQVSYRMERPDDPKNELKVWEAARATSAAPTFFRPFINSRTKEGFIDGAVFYNNPVRIANYERQLIWPDVEDCHPDILLSIGTGNNGKDTDGFVDPNKTDRRRLTKPRPNEKRRPPPNRRPFFEMQSWISVLFNRVDNLLDSESTWQEFRKDVIGNSSYIQAQRYIRVNPKMQIRTPKMDEKGQLTKLYDDVKLRLHTHGYRLKIQKIAYRLVATSFYFEKTAPIRETDDHWIVQGTICSRFARGSENLRSMGDYLKKRQFHSFQPYFNVQELKFEERAQRIRISPEIIRSMIEFGYFDIGSIAIPVSSPSAVVSIDMHLTNDKNQPHPFCGFPISAFPRSLADAETPKKPPTPGSPDLERPKLARKRESLRHKRLSRPLLPSAGSQSSEVSSNDNADFPENPERVGDWARRRIEAKRAPPKPMQSIEIPAVFELDGSAIVNSRLDVSPLDEAESDDMALAWALQRSEQESFTVRRSNTKTYEDELDRAL